MISFGYVFPFAHCLLPVGPLCCLLACCPSSYAFCLASGSWWGSQAGNERDEKATNDASETTWIACTPGE